jgi:beta-N-acetylhexosaminidase
MKSDETRILIGQRLVTGFPGTQMSEEFIRVVKQYKVANVILFRENIESEAQMRALCADIQKLVKAETGHEAFITIDQEGGPVTRLPETSVNIPGAMALAATQDPKNAYEAGYLTGAELRSLGVNFDLAPSVDINCNPANPIIGVRSYGDTAETVSKFGAEMIRGLSAGGVLSSAKHFPGHGDTSTDSHLSLPRVDKTREELERMELAPFRAAIAAGVSAITTAHILYPALDDSGVPATMSRRIVTDLLRGEMGFKGLVISDCMEMQAIQKFFGSVNGVIAAMRAGVDLVFLSHTTELAGKAAEAAYNALEAGELSMEEIEQSAKRILAAKQKLAQSVPAAYDAAAAAKKNAELLRATITEVHVPAAGRPQLGSHPLCLGCPSYRTGLVGNVVDDVKAAFPVLLAPMLGGEGVSTPIDPTDEEIAALKAKAAGYTGIVVGTYNGHLHPAQLRLIRALAELNLPIAAVALRNPYDLADLPENVYSLEAYEYTTQATKAVADVLCGREKAAGKLSVRLPESKTEAV